MKKKKFKTSAELRRLIKYANGLGVKVSMLPYTRGSGLGGWVLDTQEIDLYVSHYFSNHCVILTLLHELGHHMDWVYKGRKTSKEVDKAFSLLSEGSIEGYRKDIPKKYRKIIYQEEIDGMAYMEIIHKELMLKIPFWKVKWDEDFDTNIYKMLYKEGRFLTLKECKELKRESRKRAYARYARTSK